MFSEEIPRFINGMALSKTEQVKWRTAPFHDPDASGPGPCIRTTPHG